MDEKNVKEDVNLKKKSVKKIQTNKQEKGKNKTIKKQNTNRLADVIVKMEEEANKIEENKKIEKKQKSETKDKSLQLSKKHDISIKTKELEKIEEEIKKQTTIPKEKMNKIYLKVFENIVLAIIVLLYFIFMNIGYTSIKQPVFITDLKVFSITLIISTICVFEYAYKKESGKYTIHGIELLTISIATLISIRIYNIYNSKFISIMTLISLLFAIYYVGKSIVIYVRKRREAEKVTNDIHRISKKKRGNT